MNDPEQPDKLMSKSQRWTIGAAIFICLLTVGLNILVREWYSPDLRYQIGDNYYLDDRVAMSCAVRNLGHQTAKAIRVYSSFDSTILSYQVGGDVSSKVIAGGVGSNRITLEIDRLPTDANFTVFYAIKQNQTRPFLEKIDFEDGLARTGEPWLWMGCLLGLGIVLNALVIWFLSKRTHKIFQAYREDEDKKIEALLEKRDKLENSEA
jgi:hypothetical protein